MSRRKGGAGGGEGGGAERAAVDLETKKKEGEHPQAEPRKRVAMDKEVKRHLAVIKRALAQLDKEGASPFDEIQHPKKRAFLTAYSLLGSKLRASEVAGIDKTLIYTPGWRDDREFQDAVERARQMAVDVLEDEAQRRAVEGWVEPVGWYKGKAGGTIRRFSDTLLIFRLKGELPQKYAERMQLSGGLATLNMDALPDELLERIARGEHPMSVLASAVERGLSPQQLGLVPAPESEGE